MKDHSVALGSGQCSTASYETYELEHSTWSGTSGVTICEELHAGCATDSVERTTPLCAVTSYTATDLGS